jgi:membrane fusion protein, multidrug efflux system
LENPIVKIRKPLRRKFFPSALALAAAMSAGVVVLVRDVLNVGGDPSGSARAVVPMPAMPVPVSPVVKKSVPVYFDYSARTESLRNITLQVKITGYLQSQIVADGADVKAGDILYKIDPRDYQAALDQLKAQAQREAAALDYARANLNRGSELVHSGYLAKDTFDQRLSALRQEEAALNADNAAIHSAELNLSYTEIRAPYSGRIGRNQAPVGTLVSVAGTVLNTLVQLDPIYVTFNPSETDLAAIEKARSSGVVAADIFLPGETQATHKGELSFLNNVVDQVTGTITARAVIANGDFTLLPGQFVRVRLHISENPDAMVVPQAALGSSQLGKYLFVVGKDNIVEQRLVSLGPTDGGVVTIEKGVSEGEQVIDGNLQKIGPGMPVHPLPHPSN